MLEKFWQKFVNLLNDDSPKRLTIISILGIFAFVFIYHVFYFNKFLPPTDGWFYLLADKINIGQIPHKDFYFCLPAGYLYVINIINKFFGDAFINMRIYGIVERCLICSLLFLSFEKYIRTDYLLISIFTALVCMSSVNYDLISSPAQTSIFCSVIVLYLWNIFFKKDSPIRNNFLLFFIGLFSVFSGLFKQNTGILVCFASFLICLLFSCKNIKQKVINFVSLFSGTFLPIVFVIAFHVHHSSFNAFVSQLFSDSASAKGGIFEMLSGIFTHNFTIGKVSLILTITLIVVYIKVLEHKTKNIWNKEKIGSANVGSVILTIFLGILAVLLANIFVYQDYIRLTIEKSYSIILSNISSMCFVVIFFLGLQALYNLFYKKEKNQYNYTLLAFAGLGFAQIIASSLSIYFDPNTMIVAIVIFYISIFNFKIPYIQYKNVLVYFFLCILIFMSTFYKYKKPYQWWGWTSYSINKSTTKVDNIPILKGFVLSEVEADVVQKVYKLSKEETLTVDDYIYAFPNVPLVHVVSGENPNFVSVFPQIDVYPDYMAINDSNYIKKHPPKIIFYIEQSTVYWQVHRKFFRGGSISAQEITNIQILKLIKDKDLKYKEIMVNYPLIMKENKKKAEGTQIKLINDKLNKLNDDKESDNLNEKFPKEDKENLHIYVRL